MGRSFFLILGWLLALAGLYASLAVLELYWNFYDWQPRYDRTAGLMILASLAALVGMAFLARATRHQVAKTVSLIACLALLGLGVYVFPAEPLTYGLFARQQASPLWYRAARLIVMILPGIFWSIAAMRAPPCGAANASASNGKPRAG